MPTVDVIIAILAQASSSRMEHRALYGLREWSWWSFKNAAAASRLKSCWMRILSTIYNIRHAAKYDLAWMCCMKKKHYAYTCHSHYTSLCHSRLQPVSWKIKYRICWIADGGDPIWNAKAGAPFLSRPGRVPISQGKPLGMHKQKLYIQPKAS